MPGKTNQQRPTPLDPPRPRRATRRKRLATVAALTLAALSVTAANHALPDAHADHPATMQRLGRLLGVGWGDGYHVCRDSGFRPGADLPPHGYPDQFGPAICRDGCGQIYPPGTGLSQVHSGLPHLLTGLPSLPAVSGPVVYPSGVAPCDNEGCDASVLPFGNPGPTPHPTHQRMDSHSSTSCDEAGCDTALDSHEWTGTENAAAGTVPAGPSAPSAESDGAMKLPQDWIVEQDVPSDDEQLKTSEPHVVEPREAASASDQSLPATVNAPKVQEPLLDFSGPDHYSSPNQRPFASADSDPADADDLFGADPLGGEPDLLNDQAIEQQLPPSAYFRGSDDLGLDDSNTRDLVAPETERPEAELPVQLPSVQLGSPRPADTPEVEAPTPEAMEAPEVLAPPIRSNPYLGTGMRSPPSKSRSAVPRVATLPHAAPARDWNPIHQPD
ncbi:hypothetical protein NZK35_16945 [Stieleria sp. ICT_E10.1]|uniref:hypothetical protein n=1 Tax=Stieleria sedimenti TaxID=2976331 RepID=UPI00217F6ABD|nr:hypothetical protein [Stieleria sedimenti]MCS7468341.1 hypothetical protein [Stieleria sedimenti]